MNQKVPAWVSILVSSARYRAQEKGIPFEITAQDVIELFEEQQGLCYWFHVPMHWRDDPSGDGQPRHPLIPTLDRAVNTRGYVRSNVVLACWAANAAKGATDLDTWEEFLGFLRAGLTS